MLQFLAQGHQQLRNVEFLVARCPDRAEGNPLICIKSSHITSQREHECYRDFNGIVLKMSNPNGTDTSKRANCFTRNQSLTTISRHEEGESRGEFLLAGSVG